MKSKIRSLISPEFIIGIVIGLAIVITYFFIICFGPTMWLTAYTNVKGYSEINEIATRIAQGETDPIMLIHKISDWVKLNIEYKASLTYYYPFKPFVLQRKSPADSRWTLTIRKGACEEYSVLFADFAKVLGLRTRVVYNLGEDHDWNEIFLNGTWVHLDSTLTPEKRFNNSGHYERPTDKGGGGKQISYVYTYDTESNKIDITPSYTEIGTLVVFVEKDGNPVVDCKVIIKSKFLMETRDNYKKPLYACENRTDSNGLAVFNLGENNYAIIAETNGLLFYTEYVNATVIEHEQVNVTIVFKEPRVRNLAQLVKVGSTEIFLLGLLYLAAIFYFIYRLIKHMLSCRVLLHLANEIVL